MDSIKLNLGYNKEIGAYVSIKRQAEKIYYRGILQDSLDIILKEVSANKECKHILLLISLLNVEDIFFGNFLDKVVSIFTNEGEVKRVLEERELKLQKKYNVTYSFTKEHLISTYILDMLRIELKKLKPIIEGDIKDILIKSFR